MTIDAGSSHSEVILYTWSDKVNGTGHARQLSSVEVSNGIDDHGEDIESTVNELYNAVASAVDQIPEGVLGPFPLFLGATAGIRILNLTKPELVDEIMSSINTNLSNSDFNGRSLDVKQVRILSGSEEGLYAWVTVNYLLNSLEDDSTAQPDEMDTLGMLDMGGASSQIAYQINETNENKNDQSVNSVSLFGKNYTVKSHSNLCFGSDQGYTRYLFELVRRHFDNTEIEKDSADNSSSIRSIKIRDPCNHDSPVEMHRGTEFTSNPCLKTLSTYDLENTEITFEPSMNHSKCASVIIDLIDQSYCEQHYALCPTSESDPAPLKTHFYAISSYYYSTKVLPSIQNGGDVFHNDTDYLHQVNHWCTTPWVEKVQLADPKYARYLCFKQLYIYYTLKTIYQFTDDQWPYIHFRNKIRDSSLGWSLGYMITETNIIPSKPVKPVIWSKYASFGSLGLLAAVMIFLTAYWIGRRSKSADINHA